MRSFFVSVLPLALGLGAQHPAVVLEIRFLDVGQGDAILIREGPHAVLVDAGLPDGGIVERLRSLAHVEVLKAPHHGDPEALTSEWLSVLRPNVVVISVGAGNLTSETLRQYGRLGRRVFRTDEDGDVAVLVDAAGKYHVRTGPHRFQ